MNCGRLISPAVPSTLKVRSGDQQFVATSAGLAAITTNGTLYTYANYAPANTSGKGIVPRDWTSQATGVASVSGWGYGGYFGGVYVQSSGAVTQMFGLGSYSQKTVGGLSGITITKTFSSDGAYLALASNGKVYYWYGNNDNWTGNTAPTATLMAGTNNVLDLNVWAYHNGNYFTGGYVIEGSPCP